MIIKNYNIDFPQFVIWFSGFLYKGENWKGNNIIVAWLLTIVLNKDLAVPEFQIRTLFLKARKMKWPSFLQTKGSTLLRRKSIISFLDSVGKN